MPLQLRGNIDYDQLGHGGAITFGVDDDTVGANLIAKYGIICRPGKPRLGTISVVGKPTTAAAIFDVLRSRDGGSTWTSLFLSGSAHQIQYPQNGSGATNGNLHEWTDFGATDLAAGDLVRLDGIQSGGATGIVIVIEF
jgi:hypothetical protein